MSTKKEAPIVIREAVVSDLEAVLRLDQALIAFDAHFDGTLDPNWSYTDDGMRFFRERITGEEGAAFVAERSGEIVGYLAGAAVEAETYRTVRRVGELECMFVGESVRRLGVGARLARRFLEWCRERGLRRVMVVASAGNRGAVRFYRRMGFADHDLVLEADLGNGAEGGAA